MAIIPLDVATRGYLDSPLSVSVDGYLSLGGAPTPPGGGLGWGALGGRPWTHPLVERDRRLKKQAKREDEEILAVIMAFMEMFRR